MLEGIRVLDLTRLLPGPYATLRLADMGAEVIKIEDGVSGDPARFMGPLHNGTGVVFLAQNRGKQSVHLNLKSDEGQDVLRHLVKQSDVLIESQRPQVMHSYGLDYESLRALNPRLVYCSLTGYGQNGPFSKLAGHDLNFMAYSGVLAQLTDERGASIVPTLQLADYIGGISATEAILAALVARERSGLGRFLDVSITDALIGFMTTHGLHHALFTDQRGLPELSGRYVCYNLYATADGRQVALAALEPKFWNLFCQKVGYEDWSGHQFSTTSKDNPIYVELCQCFWSRTCAEWGAFAREHDCCLSPVLTLEEALASEYAQDSHLTFELHSRKWGTLFQVKTSAGGRNVLSEDVLSSPPELADSPQDG